MSNIKSITVIVYFVSNVSEQVPRGTKFENIEKYDTHRIEGQSFLYLHCKNKDIHIINIQHVRFYTVVNK